MKILERFRVRFHLELSKYKQLRFIQLFFGHSGDRDCLIRFPLRFVFVVIFNCDGFGESYPWIAFLLSASVDESKDPGGSP